MKKQTKTAPAVTSLKGKCTCEIGLLPCQLHGWNLPSMPVKEKKLVPDNSLVSRIESYIRRYVTFQDSAVTLPLALWLLGTFVYNEFDAFPYLVITSATKRSGKTRLWEVLSFACHNPYNFAAVTGAVMFRLIAGNEPTIGFDEAENLSSEAANTMRSVLNVGYRKGQTIPRIVKESVVQFPTYCPKVFILIGDTYDTLRDRSIIITLTRAEAPQRFLIGEATEAGAVLRQECHTVMTDTMKAKIAETFNAHESLGFLQDREEEIWMPLFSLAKLFCPERIAELSRAASDLAADKTADIRRYTQLHEDPTQDAQYAEKLLVDLYSILLVEGKAIGSADAVAALLDVPTAPWRKFRGRGLRQHDMSNMLSRFSVRPKVIAKGSGRGQQTFMRGYSRADVEAAIKGLK